MNGAGRLFPDPTFIFRYIFQMADSPDTLITVEGGTGLSYPSRRDDREFILNELLISPRQATAQTVTETSA